MQAKELISEQIPVLDLSDSCMHALDLMRKSKFNDLPVVHNGKYAGLISESIIMRINNLESLVSDAISYTPMVFAHQLWIDAIPILSQFNISLIPVVTDEKIYMGSILLETLVGKFAELMNLSENNLMIIEINSQDYIPSEIAKLAEANNAKILTLFTQPIKQTNKLWVYLTLSMDDITPAICCFERLDYKIIYHSTQQTTMDNMLKERLDEFLHYLKI